MRILTSTGSQFRQVASVHFNEAVAWRRSLHQRPQPAWLEFFATAMIAEKLSAWGYDVKMGQEILDKLDERGIIKDYIDNCQNDFNFVVIIRFYK